ncbi:MAG: hypothetical protein WC682_03935 [Parcubacteria group bacterium]|jgi:hypothetical protein
MSTTAQSTQQQKNPFISDGEKLAKTQLLVNKLITLLNSGNFWSAEDVKKILENYKEKLDGITKGFPA